jgi:hypothetical protein
MTWLGSRGSGLVALGAFLARRGLTAAIGLGMTVAGVGGFGALAIYVARRNREALPKVPLMASSALAFGVGVLVAFAISTRVFRRDEDDGVRALLRVHGISPTRYLMARVAGLTAFLALLVAGGTLLVGLVAILAARNRAIAVHTLQASLAGVVFALAFAATFAPVAMATLAGRSRGAGYLALLVVLVVPELVAPSLGRWMAPHWADLCSIPGALLALRTSVAPVGVDVFLLGRSSAVILAIIAVALLFVRLELARVPPGRPPERTTT